MACPQRKNGIVLLGLATLVFLASPVGCGGPEPGGPRVLRFAHVYEPGSPTHKYGAARLAELVAAANVGLEIRVFPSAQLGNEGELLEQIATGQLEMAIAGPSFLAMWHEPIGAFDAAYAFDDVRHLAEVSDGPIGEELWEGLRERQGIRVLGTWFYGVRHITSNRPIRQPADLNGFRLRMPGAKVWQASGRALGASPMPINFGEVYLALQQGMADGQENPVPTIQAMGFHEVQKYLNLTGHIQSSTQVLVAELVWEELSIAQQDALHRAVRTTALEVRDGIAHDEENILCKWRETGAMEVVADVDVEAFRRHARRHFEDGWSFSELYRRIVALREEDRPE
ncbi:MAG: DctP family TRAP transporter solute-binding subunit [Patescibacteria group bacterium]|nr:DctP family TRAP transporter solute-binding subunit [Patescibacteria group bacterium]